jgi:hypothetical protein
MFSIQVSWLPGGTGIFGRMSSGRTRRSAPPPRWVCPLPTRIFGRMSSGADTEVRPPAILVLGPEGCFSVVGCPAGIRHKPLFILCL